MNAVEPSILSWSVREAGVADATEAASNRPASEKVLAFDFPFLRCSGRPGLIPSPFGGMIEVRLGRDGSEVGKRKRRGRSWEE